MKTVGNITVKVTDGTDAISGATVTIIDEDSQTTSETTNEEGEVLFEELPNGIYSLSVGKEGYAIVTDEVIVNGEDETINIALIAIGDLTITVDNGADPAVAIEGATVVIGETTKTTDSNGEVEFNDMPYGDCIATITMEGYVTATETIAFRSNHKSFTISLTSA